MAGQRIDSYFHTQLRRAPERYHAACDFIRSLADFEEHPLESGSQLFFDVRAVMFFEIDARWNFTGDAAFVWRDEIHAGNEKSFLESLDALRS